MHRFHFVKTLLLSLGWACAAALHGEGAFAQASVEAPSAAASAAAPALATSLPRWEVGVAAVVLHGPDYPGASTHRWRGALAPVGIYRGKRMRFDDEGVSGRLLNTGSFEVDISGAAAFNARQTEARSGMPALGYTVELGPQALYRTRLAGGHELSAHIKWRAVASVQSGGLRGRGSVLEPELRWQRRGWPDAASTLRVSGQGVWASEALQDYFYQVDAAYATPNRPAYSAHGGYFGSSLRGHYSRRLSASALLALGANFSTYRGAANAGSPLLPQRDTAGVFVAVVWTPWRSQESTAE
jgi:MipA family protein